MKTLYKTISIISFTILFWACSSTEGDTITCENECEYIIESGETAGTVPISIEGTFELSFAKNSQSTNTYYDDGVKGTFTIASNTLTLGVEGKDCITLKNPIQSSPSENTFVNSCGTNFVYAVSTDLNGNINEINVLNRNGTRFFGQFK